MKNKRLCKQLNLLAHEAIVTAWCEVASGSGWSNRILNVLIRDGNGKLRLEYLQPDEHPKALATIFGVAAHMERAVMGIVEGANHDQ